MENRINRAELKLADVEDLLDQDLVDQDLLDQDLVDQDLRRSMESGCQALTGPSGKTHRPMNINHYATKKTVAQSMLDVALLMANSSQLKTALYVGPQYHFYTPLVVLLSLSITLQVIVGLLLIFIAVKYDLNDVRKHAKLNRMNNVATVFVFFTVLINIFITALGFEGQVVRSLASPVISISEPPSGENLTSSG